MTQSSAYASPPHELPSNADGRRVDEYVESFATGRELYSPFLPDSVGYMEAGGGQPTAPVDAFEQPANLQGYHEYGAAACVSSDRSTGFATSLPPSAPRRGYFLDPAGAFSCGRTAALGTARFAALPYSFAAARMGLHQHTPSRTAPYGVPTVEVRGGVVHSTDRPAQPTSSPPRDGADRRTQTQRPVHRAHPYGSSLLGRLLNRITSSLTSLSGLVPRAPGHSSTSEENTGAAGTTVPSAASGGLPEPCEETTTSHKVPRSPLQEPACGSSYPYSGVSLYAPRKPGGAGAVHAGSSITGAASPAPYVPTDAVCAAPEDKHLQGVCGGTATESGGECSWLSDRQQPLPYPHMRTAANTATGALLTDSRDVSSGRSSGLPSSYQQVQLQQQQQQMQQKQQQMPQQQQVQERELAGAPGSAKSDAEAQEFRRPVRFAAPAAEAYDDYRQSHMPLAPNLTRIHVDAVRERKAGDRRHAVAAGLGTHRYNFYEGSGQQVLAESCFDTAGGRGSPLVNADADTGGDTFRIPRSVLQPQQQRRQLIGGDRDGLGGAMRVASDNPLEDDVFLSDYYGLQYAAPTTGVFGSGERLSFSKGNAAWVAQGYERPEQQQPHQKPCRSLARPVESSALPLAMRRGLLRGEGLDASWPQQGERAGDRVPLPDLQEEVDAGVPMARTCSSSAHNKTGTDKECSHAHPPRRMREGGDGSSALFSRAVAPAWLSSPGSELLDIHTRERGTAGRDAAAAGGATIDRGQSGHAARSPLRSKRGSGATARKASHTGVHPYQRQEQLTVEQLQKLYLRCQPLRWRVRLRDLLRQEATAAAAAETEQRKASEQKQPPVAAGATASGVKSSVAVAENAAAVQPEVPAKTRRLSFDNPSGQAQQGTEERGSKEVTGGGVADETDQSMQPPSRTQRVSKEQEWHAGVVADEAGSSLCTPSLPGGAAEQANRKEETTKEHKQPEAGPQGAPAVRADESGKAAGPAVHEQVGKDSIGGDMAGAKGSVAVLAKPGAAAHGVDAAEGSRSTKRSREASEPRTEGGAVGSLFGGVASGAGGLGPPSSSALFGSTSSKGLFDIGKTTPLTTSLESVKADGGRPLEAQDGAARISLSEKASSSLFGKPPVPPSLSGSSSMIDGVPATSAAQQPQQESKEGASQAGARSSSLFGGTTPASTLFGGVGHTSTQQPLKPLAGAEPASGALQPPGQKEAEKKEVAQKDTKSPTSATTAAPTVGGKESSATDTSAKGTAALPWWQQNLNKPCSVLPEEDFAPDADNEDGALEEDDKEAQKEPPPLKVPSIFGNASSGGGLFGSTGASTSSFSLFKSAAVPSSSPDTSASAVPPPTTAGTTTRPPPLFGSISTASQWTPTSSGSSLFGGLKPTAVVTGATMPPSGSLFGGRETNKQPISQLSSAKADAPLSSDSKSSSSGTSIATQSTSLFGNLAPSSSAFATQKSCASLFGGSIFGNPVAAAQSTSSSQQTAGTSGMPGAKGGLFVFGAGVGGITPPPPATTATPTGQSQPATGGTPAVPSLFGSVVQQSQQSSGGKRGRDATESAGAAAARAPKSLFGSTPAPTTAGGGLGLFGQRPPAGGSTLFGGDPTGSSGLFGTRGPLTSTAGQLDKNAVGGGMGGGGVFGDRSTINTTGGSLFGAARSVTPVFGSSNTGKDSKGTSAPASGGIAAPGATAATGSSLGLFGSSSNNNPFGFGGSLGTGGASLFGDGTSVPNESTRSATAEGSSTGSQPQWSAGKGLATTQGLFSVANNSSAGSSAAVSRPDTSDAGRGTSSEMQQSSGVVLGGAVGGTPSSPPGTIGARSTTNLQGGLSTGPTSLFGNAPGTSVFTFGTAPATAIGQQQPQQPSITPGVPTAGAPPASGAEAGNAANAFFGALPPGVRRPRLTIKRSKQ